MMNKIPNKKHKIGDKVTVMFSRSNGRKVKVRGMVKKVTFTPGWYNYIITQGVCEDFLARVTTK